MSSNLARTDALDSNLNRLGLLVFLSNVGGFIRALRLPPPIKTGRQEIAPKRSLEVKLKHQNQIKSRKKK